jgi:hypothetical protein
LGSDGLGPKSLSTRGMQGDDRRVPSPVAVSAEQLATRIRPSTPINAAKLLIQVVMRTKCLYELDHAPYFTHVEHEVVRRGGGPGIRAVPICE